MVLNALLIYYRLNSYKSQVFVDMYININNKQIKMVETFTIFICIPLQFFFFGLCGLSMEPIAIHTVQSLRYITIT